jgi:competence protein ComEC
MPERSFGFAQAIISGDRLNLSLQVIEDLRRMNLAHLLAISGLHMGLLTTVVFGLLRMVFVAIPIGHIRWHARSIAAFGAILAEVAYLGLSGNSIATQRAFVMIACFFGGVILSRRALTLRSLALAALIILALRPEALYSPGFQMSFAATIALVSVFYFITRRGWVSSGLVMNYITGAVVSSVIAGLATAPIAAIHFNQISQIGYIANLLAVPVMALVVAPAAVVALALSPLLLAPVGFWFVDLGLTWKQFIAGYLAEFDVAVRMIKTPTDGVLPLFSFGVLWCVLWSGKFGKSIGILAAIIALGMWVTTQRPEILISDQGRLIGVLSDQGRALSEAAKTHTYDPTELIVSHHDIEVIGRCLVLQKRDFYDFGTTYVVWTREGYRIKKRVDKHHAPYPWQSTSKQRQSIRADQSD